MRFGVWGSCVNPNSDKNHRNPNSEEEKEEAMGESVKFKNQNLYIVYISKAMKRKLKSVAVYWD